MHLLPSKLFDFDNACSMRIALAKLNKSVVLTNGCFDLLHAGHIFSLTNAKKFGDSLWIALNSDTSVRHLKGDSRPIFNENIRAYMLSALSVIDGIFIFHGDRLADELMQFCPDVYVKSGDYTIEKLDTDERQALEVVKAKIEFVPYISGFSTTSIIKKISN